MFPIIVFLKLRSLYYGLVDGTNYRHLYEYLCVKLIIIFCKPVHETKSRQIFTASEKLNICIIILLTGKYILYEGTRKRNS